jgi:CRP-like cAMP-binding protein
MSTENTNLLLKALSAKSRDRLLSRSTAVSLPLKFALYEPEQQPRYGYFLTSGVASVVAQTAEGSSAEVGMIGAEGVAGAIHLLGPGPVSSQCFMQAEGTALRIPFVDLHIAFRDSHEIRERILEFVQVQALSSSQISACHRLHDAEERLSRWLLMVRDRVNSDILGLTQEFLAEMLGSRRTTVTLVAGVLQSSGLIEYRRGRVRIQDRERLEEAACSCYPLLRDLSVNLYANPLRDGHEHE